MKIPSRLNRRQPRHVGGSGDGDSGKKKKRRRLKAKNTLCARSRSCDIKRQTHTNPCAEQPRVGRKPCSWKPSSAPLARRRRIASGRRRRTGTLLASLVLGVRRTDGNAAVSRGPGPGTAVLAVKRVGVWRFAVRPESTRQISGKIEKRTVDTRRRKKSSRPSGMPCRVYFQRYDDARLEMLTRVSRRVLDNPAFTRQRYIKARFRRAVAGRIENRSFVTLDTS